MQQDNENFAVCPQCNTFKKRARRERKQCADCRKNQMRDIHKRNYPKNKERMTAYTREWREKNPDYNRIKTAEYRAANKEKHRLARRNNMRKRRKDIAYRAAHNISVRIAVLLKNNKFAKHETTSSIIGYDIKLLGEWAKANGYKPPHNHIDHKEPVAYYLRLYPDDIDRAMKEAWRIDNLQILSARDNIRKGDMRYGEWLKTRK